MMKKSRAKHIGLTDDGLGWDWGRRLKNATLALALLDPGWMAWVEREIPKQMTLKIKARWIERQARLRMARKYGFLGWAAQAGMIYGDFYFTEAGDLKTYL